MKVQPSIKKICSKCKIVIRRKAGKSRRHSQKPVRMVICTNAKHKQRQG